MEQDGAGTLRIEHDPAPIWYPWPDFADLPGHEGAKRALKIVAAGGHNLLLRGPRGAGKTTLARCLPGLLPPLDRQESREVEELLARAGHSAEGEGVRPPFRCPDPGSTAAAMMGAGPAGRPGEIRLAHRGFLFLDDLPRFRAATLARLRLPLADGVVMVGRRTLPACFSLIATIDSCPCGTRGAPRTDCRCRPGSVQRHLMRALGPLAGRFDLCVEVLPLTTKQYRTKRHETSAEAATEVAYARRVQRERFGSGSPGLNAKMRPEQLATFARLCADGTALLEGALERGILSRGDLARALQVARTVADLDGAGPIQPTHLAEALQYGARSAEI